MIGRYLILASAFLFCSAATEEPPLIGPAQVANGSTLRFGELLVPLIGIDAPSSPQHCVSGSGEFYNCGRTSAEALNALVAGRVVECHHAGGGRSSARCTVAGLDLAEAMLRAGQAVIVEGGDMPSYAAAETEARENGRGIWAGQFVYPAKWRVLFRYSSPIAAVPARTSE